MLLVSPKLALFSSRQRRGFPAPSFTFSKDGINHGLRQYAARWGREAPIKWERRLPGDLLSRGKGTELHPCPSGLKGLGLIVVGSQVLKLEDEWHAHALHRPLR